MRQAGLSYDEWRYVARRVRQKCDLHPAAKPKKLPRILTADQFRAFYKAVDEADDVQHGLMLRLLFYTGVRVSELCGIEVSDVDLENCKIFVNQGKGTRIATSSSARASPPRFVPTSPPIPHNRWLFQTRRCGRFSTRRVQQVVKLYAERAGVTATPHTLRHQALTWLTKNSGMADAEIQLLSGIPAGRRWRSTSTSPWMGSWRTSTSRR